MTEEELIQQSKNGDLDSFNQLVDMYQRQVYNLTLRMLGNYQDAEDTAQEAFILAWRSVRKFRGGSFRAWLLRIASNACTDFLRSNRKRFKKTESLDELFPDRLPIASSSDPPESYSMREELQRVIAECLLSLPEEQRLVVTLADLQGLTYEEVAQVTNSSIGTVKSRLNRGRAGMRNLLSERKELLPPEFRLNK